MPCACKVHRSCFTMTAAVKIPPLPLLPLVLLLMVGHFVGRSECANCSTDVRVLFVGFRHGARSVAVFLPNDDNNNKWTVGLGQLTPQGMGQHYRNGQLIRDRYSPMFSRYDPTRILSRSSPVDRTLMSASTFLAALVQPTGNQIFKEGFNWQPAALYTTIILQADVPQRILNRAAQEAMPGIIASDPSTVSTLEHASGIKALREPFLFFFLTDNIVTEAFANFSLPYGLDQSLLPNIQALKDRLFVAIFGDQEVRCQLAPAILHDMIEKAERTLRNDTTHSVYIWSMHDANVHAVLSMLNNYRSESPPFAATILFEVRPLQNCQDYEVRFIYRKTIDGDYVQLEILRCSTPCTLIQLKTIVERIENECRFNASSPQFSSCYG